MIHDEFLKHPYTCGLCSWGRDGAYHSESEYQNHMSHVHPDEWALECPTCIKFKGQMMPPHRASPKCESGGYNHCSCDICF